jgi:ABC-type Fe3+ transport system permease subunit
LLGIVLFLGVMASPAAADNSGRDGGSQPTDPGVAANTGSRSGGLALTGTSVLFLVIIGTTLVGFGTAFVLTGREKPDEA